LKRGIFACGACFCKAASSWRSAASVPGNGARSASFPGTPAPAKLSLGAPAQPPAKLALRAPLAAGWLDSSSLGPASSRIRISAEVFKTAQRGRARRAKLSTLRVGLGPCQGISWSPSGFTPSVGLGLRLLLLAPAFAFSLSGSCFRFWPPPLSLFPPPRKQKKGSILG
jgi:hypothetical protein